MVAVGTHERRRVLWADLCEYGAAETGQARALAQLEQHQLGEAETAPIAVHAEQAHLDGRLLLHVQVQIARRGAHETN